MPVNHCAAVLILLALSESSQKLFNCLSVANRNKHIFVFYLLLKNPSLGCHVGIRHIIHEQSLNKYVNYLSKMPIFLWFCLLFSLDIEWSTINIDRHSHTSLHHSSSLKFANHLMFFQNTPFHITKYYKNYWKLKIADRAEKG